MNSTNVPAGSDVNHEPLLEDALHDVINKALRGCRVSTSQLAARANVSQATVEEFLDTGSADDSVVESIIAAACHFLPLRASQCRDLFKGRYHPHTDLPSDIRRITTDHEGMAVDCFLLWDSKKRGALFDTGACATTVIRVVNDLEIQLQDIFLTHTHDDHCACFIELASHFKVSGWVHQDEPAQGLPLKTFNNGWSRAVGDLTVTPRPTAGHSAGGVTYVIDGLAVPVAVVGDAIFAGSLGGGLVSFSKALTGVREQIMTLPLETILLPGHGPVTTVAQERAHNPFAIETIPT